jgi:hypothetical protein
LIEDDENEVDEWKEFTTAEAKVFYYNPKLKKSLWTKPE